MTYKLGKYFAAALSLLLLAACSQDKDIVQQGSTNDEPPIQMLANFEADFEGFQTASAETKDERQQARSFSTPKGVRGDVQIIVEDGMSYILTDERKPSSVKSKWAHINRGSLGKKGTEQMNMLLVIRLKSDTTKVAVTPLAWDYYDNTAPATVGGQLIPQPRYRIVNEKVNVPAGFAEGMAIEARVLAGGYYDKDDKKIRVPAGMTEVIDLGGKNNAMVPMPVPFISPWYDVQADPNKTLQFSRNTFAPVGSGRIKNSQNYFRLKPLGTLVTTTLRNTSDQDVTIDGIDFQTNALHLGEVEIDPATFSVSGDMTHNNAVKGIKISNVEDLAAGQLPSAGKVGKYTMPESGDIFYRVSLSNTDNKPISLPKQGKNEYKVSDIIFVTWGMPVDGKYIGTARGVETNPATGKPYIDDIKQTFNYAQTQIYARGVKADGKPVTRPNYSIVPIMGTDYNLASGKSYTLNAELYKQPNVLLGYYAKYLVKEDGTGFTEDHAKSAGRAGSNKPNENMVNFQTAYEFVNGKELPIPNPSNDQTTPSGNATYFIPPSSAWNTVGLNGGPIFKRMESNYAGLKIYGNYASQAWLPGVRFELAGIAHDPSTGTIDFGNDELSKNPYTYGVMYAYDLSTAHTEGSFRAVNIAYAITNKATVYGTHMNRVQQADQTLWRYELQRPSDTPRTDTRTGEYSLDVRAIFVGKYFVGNSFSPIYNGANLLQEEKLWEDPTAKLNQVERYLPSRGIYTAESATRQADGTYEFKNLFNLSAEEAKSKTFKWRNSSPSEPIPVFWSVSNGYSMARILYWYKHKINSDVAYNPEELISRLLEYSPTSSTPTSDGLQTFIDSKKRYGGNSFTLSRYLNYPINGNSWTGASTTLGIADLINRPTFHYVRMYLPLLPVSTTYQGDSKD